MSDKKIAFEFVCQGNLLTLDGNVFGILDYEGLEATEYDLNIQQNINYAGGKILKKNVLPRPVSIEFEYKGKNKGEIRQELISFFTPYSSGNLTVNYLGIERQIEYEVNSFQTVNKNLYMPVRCLLELTCLDPMFKDILQTGERIDTWVGGWKWKFTLPFKMKTRGQPQKEIINSGHVETPVEIIFHGPAAYPKVTNLTTGEFIRIKQELTGDDTLYINTAFSQKTVEIERDGVREDAFDYIDLASSFFCLQPGRNIVEYESENGLDPQSVELCYYNRYIGV